MRIFLLVLAAVSAVGVQMSGAESAPKVDFSRDIRPILTDRCLHCHGPDAATRKAGLRLDIEAEAKKEAIVPGNPDASELIKRVISQDPDEIMPPAESHKPALTPAEVETFRNWIAQGAVWSSHWAFAPISSPAPPAVADATWPRNDIDRFILARLEKEGLKPSPEAAREVLIRRLSLDLTGLPPTPAEVDAFLADTRPNAYEALVDRLQASPHYGERMALDWLDGARYADTNGFQNDFQRYMWPWRDWVIKAFNENMPFDQFTREQIAGDMLPNATDSQRVGSGFNRNNRATTEGGSIEEEWYIENRIDRVETTSAVFLGLTMGCARCHDHKYDPISQREFYEFFSFFDSSKDIGFYNETRGNVGPMVQLPSEENKAKIADFEKRIGDAVHALEQAKQASAAGYDTWAQGLAAPLSAAPPVGVLEMPLHGNLFLTGSAAVPGFPGASGPTWRDGLFGPALELDGTSESHVNAGDAATFPADKPFSISVWVRPETPGAIFSRMDDGANYRGIDLMIGSEMKFAVHFVNEWTANAIKVNSDTALATGTWSHVCITYDGSSKAAGVKAYLNGQEVKMQPEIDALTGPTDTTQPLRLGRRSTGAFYKGGIADFAVFDRTLTKDEAALRMKARLAEASGLPQTEERTASLRALYTSFENQRLAEQQRGIDKIVQAKNEYVRDQVPSVMVMEEMEKPRETYRLARGQYDQPDKSEVLKPKVPAFLPQLPEGAQNRLGLANWLVDPANPLTARVTVNRVWYAFFGQGIVKSLDNFGLQGETPSHPELLDWLASNFVANKWDLKALQKLIVTSAAYRQQSAFTEQLRERDPENQLLARGPRYRLQAEMIRDSALAVSGLLAPKIGGPSVKPYQPEGLWAELAGGAGEGPYVQSTGEDLYRRSLYTYRKRTVSHPTVATFDAPSWETCRVYRARTNTPLQELALLNDTTYVEAARGLAERLMKEAPSLEDRVRLGFKIVTGRMPNPVEEEVLRSGAAGYLENFKADPVAALEFVTAGDSEPAEGIDRMELAAYTAVASVLLNMDTTITKE